MKLTLGQQVKARGLDMNCKPSVELMRIVRILSEEERVKYMGRYDCVTQGFDGIKVLDNSAKFLKGGN